MTRKALEKKLKSLQNKKEKLVVKKDEVVKKQFEIEDSMDDYNDSSKYNKFVDKDFELAEQIKDVEKQIKNVKAQIKRKKDSEEKVLFSKLTPEHQELFNTFLSDKTYQLAFGSFAGLVYVSKEQFLYDYDKNNPYVLYDAEGQIVASKTVEKIDFENDTKIIYTAEDGDEYTGKQFLEICFGKRELAQCVYESCEWQHPETIIDEIQNNSDEYFAYKFIKVDEYYKDFDTEMSKKPFGIIYGEFNEVLDEFNNQHKRVWFETEIERNLFINSNLVNYRNVV